MVIPIVDVVDDEEEDDAELRLTLSEAVLAEMIENGAIDVDPEDDEKAAKIRRKHLVDVLVALGLI